MGKKSTKVKESAHERELTRIGQLQNQRYESLYRPVEKTLMKEADRDLSKTLAGRATADAAQATSGGFDVIRPTATDTGGVRAEAIRESQGTALSLGDSAKNEIIKVGQGQASGAQQGLAVAARSATNSAIAKSKANIDKMNAYSQLIGTAGAFAYKGLNGAKVSPSTTFKSKARYTTDDLEELG